MAAAAATARGNDRATVFQTRVGVPLARRRGACNVTMCNHDFESIHEQLGMP